MCKAALAPIPLSPSIGRLVRAQVAAQWTLTLSDFHSVGVFGVWTVMDHLWIKECHIFVAVLQLALCLFSLIVIFNQLVFNQLVICGHHFHF